MVAKTVRKIFFFFFSFFKGPISTVMDKFLPAGGSVLTWSHMLHSKLFRICVHIRRLHHNNVPLETTEIRT